ncbi:BCL9 domain-containing protein legless isoform 2-T3 [Glossina fuscipes fuscipes]
MLISANTTLKPAATTATAMPPSAVTSPSSPLITMMTTTINTSTTATSVLPVMSSSISTPPVSAESPTVQSLNITTNTKCDAPFGNETSPCNSESNNSQHTTLDDHPIIKKSNNNTSHERESSSNISSGSLLRKSSANINSCSIQYNESSPNNSGSDHSNSSSTPQPILDNNGNDDEKKGTIKEEDREKSNGSISSSSSISSSGSNTSFSSSSSSTTAGIKSIASAEEEKGVAIKKEENNMSPVGFGSIGNVNHNASLLENSGTSLSSQINESAANNSISDKMINLSNTGCGDDNDCSANNANAGGLEILPISNANSHSLVTKANDYCSESVVINNAPTTPMSHNSIHTYNANTNTSGSSMMGGSCLDYMQQQNHIFVFSTQLANKGAEAVLTGLCPTIIAYHCTQPATKSFLEDFFLKNSMKMTKLQRQNTLNICNMSSGGIGVGTQSWLNTITKMPHKSEMNALTGDENDVLCWEQNRSSGIDTSTENNAIKILDNVDAGSKLGSSEVDNNAIPSLQGVKVPDENLTPQQRQHREEQLAKLKKMNQFLFPENGSNEFRADMTGSQLGKVSVDAATGNLSANSMLALSGSTGQLGNKIGPTVRGVQSNMITHGKVTNCNSDAITGLGQDVLLPSDMINAGDVPIITGCSGPSKGPKNMQMNNHSNMDSILSSMNSNINMITNMSGSSIPANPPISMTTGNMIKKNSVPIITGSSASNIVNNSMVCSVSANDINDPNGGGMPNNSDLLTSFGQNFPSVNDTNKHMANAHSEMVQAGSIAQIEWSKLQQPFYEERLKGNVPDLTCNALSNPSTRANPVSMNLTSRPNTTTACMSTNAQNNRPGPPPPYHCTQRPASVPITSQSPSSPHNPTSNLSLPSPRISGGVMGVPTNSPNMDVSASSVAATPATSTCTTTGATSNSANTSLQPKISYSQEGSPSAINQSAAAGLSTRGRNTTNSLNSNPSTPLSLSHVSPKDLDTSNINTSATDQKSTRPSPQRSRSPLLMASNTGGLVEISNLEPRFSSPGQNFANGINGGSSNPFKNQSGVLDRQNMTGQMSSHFSRRPDNMPLNPNNNRTGQSKMTNSFDPITSLAQMSQQLGVGVNMASTPGSIGALGTGSAVNDMSPSTNMNMDSLMSSLDPSISEHCNSAGGNMGIVGSSSVSFGPSNCHMIGPMGQRLMSPKMCGNANVATFTSVNTSMRESSAPFSGMMSTHRMVNHRISTNFANFNVSPNIQVKASTPNTIQYMPVRPQNNNNNTMRATPSLEFLRYTNPQLIGPAGSLSGVGVLDSSSHITQMNAANDIGKVANASNGLGTNMQQMNFYGNCNQINSVGMVEQDELQSTGGLLSPHDLNLNQHGNVLRGMRPMRQPSMAQGGGLAGPRMQLPGMPNITSTGSNALSPFSGNDPESMDISESSPSMFNSAASGGGQLQMYQQKPNKSMALNAVNAGATVLIGPGPSNNILPNPLNVNGNIMPAGCSSGSINYKSFVGPTSNDLKYAQQYHTFQQQLYATSTRNQQPGNSANIMNPTNNSNAGFFVNK